MTKELLDNLKALKHCESFKLNFKNKTLNGKDLYLRAVAIGNNLSNYCNKNIFYLGGKSINLLPVAYGIMLSGNFYTPINNKDGIKRLLKIISSVKNPVVIIENKDFIPKLGNIETLNVEDLIKGDAAFSFNQSNNNDIAYTIFTSGSTGVPKGVNILYESLSELINWYSNYLNLNDKSVTSLIAQPHFDLSIPDIFSPLIFKGVLNIVPNEFILFPNSLVEFIHNNEIENISLVPTLFIKIAGCINSSKLKNIVIIGEKFPYSQAFDINRRLKNIKLYNMYGPTEGCFCSSSHLFNLDLDSLNVPIGLPRANNQYKIVNSELHIGGPCVSSGYLNLVSDSFYSENGVRWYKTGDIVEYKNGNYYFLDRVDRQVQNKGYRVELSEIESVLSSKIDYRLGVIFTDKIICFIESNNNINSQITFLKEYQKENLPLYMRVLEFIPIREMPKNSSGKIDYNRLSEMYKNEQ